jgi:polyisoprenoid-binding protein YceI
LSPIAADHIPRFVAQPLQILGQLASVDTNEAQRDEHLRSAEFFDAETHGELSYEATSIEQLDEETLRIVGELTMNGITRELELEAEVLGTGLEASDEERLGLQLTGRLSRREYGMRFNAALGSGNAVVGDKVKFELDIAAVKQT